MFSKVLSSAVLGIDAYIVEVETDIARQMPYFSTVGLPDGAVKESKDRVTAAIKNSGYVFPRGRITVNLAPADVRKEGSAFDLPIAVGILAATGQVPEDRLDQYALLGELSLDGSLRPIRGALSIAVAVKNAGLKGILLPPENAEEAAMAKDLEVYPVVSLSEAVDFLNGFSGARPFGMDMDEVFAQSSAYSIDFSDVNSSETQLTALRSELTYISILPSSCRMILPSPINPLRRSLLASKSISGSA